MEADGVEERGQAEHARSLIDMHVHSTLGSADSNLTPDQLVRRARTLGLAGAALTEHYRVWPDEEVARVQAPDLALLPAAEWSTDLGHILCFGIERHVSGMSRAEDVREYVLERRGFMVAAHPFRYAFTTQERHAYLGTRGRMTAEQAAEAPVFRLVDEIEVCNGGCTDEENLFALQVAHLLGKRGIAGTDAHRESNLGYCATAFERPVADMESLLAELRAGRFAPVVGIGRGLCLPFDASSLTVLETMQRDASRRTG